MKNIEYEVIEMRFSSSYLTDVKAVEKTSTSIKLIPDTSVLSNHVDNSVAVPGPVFELLCSLIENARISHVKSMSASFDDGSVMSSGEKSEA